MTNFNPETLAAALMPKHIQLESASLSIMLYIRHHHVQVSVFDPAKQTIVWDGTFETDPLQSEWESVLEFIKARNWHRTVFGSATVVYDNEKGILTPRGLWTPELTQSMYQLESGEELVHPVSIQIPEWDVVYSAESPSWSDVIRPLFPNALLTPLDALLLRYARVVFDKQATAYIYYSGDSFRILITDHTRLLLCNRYSGRTPTDFLYFLRVASAACQLELNELKIRFFGESTFSFTEIGYYLQQEEPWCVSEANFWAEIHRKCAL
jgi:hypothetical protein